MGVHRDARGPASIYTTPDVGEADRHADRVLVLADGKLLYIGTPDELSGDRDLRVLRSSRLVLAPDQGSPGYLRRSPLLVGLLILYPVVVAGMAGAGAHGRAGEAAGRVRQPRRRRDVQPRRADARRHDLHVGELFDAVDPIRVDSREAAIEKVRSGEALAALGDPRRRHPEAAGDALRLGGGTRPPSTRSSTTPRTRSSGATSKSTIRARLADADAALSDAVLAQSAKYLDLVVKGGKLSFPLVGEVEILGLHNARTLIDKRAQPGPEGRPAARAAAAGQPLRPPRRRQPRPQQADPVVDRSAGEDQADPREGSGAGRWTGLLGRSRRRSR